MIGDKLISVIVPCYNVEQYLEKCLNCLLNQTYKNLSIIAIDDCSTDNTYEVLKRFEKENPNKIKVYQNESNCGLAATRNKGIDYAKSECIGFIDPDDFVDYNYYEELIKAMDSNDADISVTDLVLADENGTEISDIQRGCINKENVTKLNVIDNGLAASACNKLFKKDIIEKHKFLEGKINEDVAAVIPAIMHSNKLAYTDKTKYYYVQRCSSIQNSSFSEKRFQMFDAIRTCLERIKDVEDYEIYRQTILFHQCLMLYIFVICNLKDKKERKKYIKLFIEKNKETQIENNWLIPRFLNTQSRIYKVYYYLLIKLLKLKSATLINTVISSKNLFYKGIDKLRAIKRKMFNPKVIKENITLDDIEKLAKKQQSKKTEKISVSAVIPNYNYEKFLLQRVYSILNQTKKVGEIVFLDDCSKDNSRELIDQIVERISKYIKVKKVYNEQNTGIAFKQWQNGFNIAEGDYVWIAEADDYCDKHLLEVLLKTIEKDPNIRIAYVDTAFIDKDGKVFLKTIKNEIDIRNTGHWNSDFINNGLEELKNYTFLNCTIANVSSCIIKKDNYDDIFEKAIKYRQAGDWVVYANVMIKGDIAYVDKPYNFYRVHGANITSTMKKQKHLDEIMSIHKEIGELITLQDWHYVEHQKRYDFLKKVWRLD
jgi:glycosyltransferase involved in cell wall biosynthesis